MNGRLPNIQVSPFLFNFANFGFPTSAGSGSIFGGGGGNVPIPVPPTPGNFELLDGTDFLLLNGTNLTLL